MTSHFFIRGPDHVTNGPCTCEKEIAIRSKNKAANEPYFSYLKSIQQVAPFGFIKVFIFLSLSAICNISYMIIYY